MILHIVPDEKFIDIAYKLFDNQNPDNNQFIIVASKSKFKYIKTTPIIKISKFEFLSKKFSNSLSKYEFIIIHSLTDITKKLILNSSNNIKFLWLGWGYDYYGYLDKKLLLEKTLNLKEKMFHKNKKRQVLLKIKNFIKNKLIYRDINNLEKIFDKINYFSPVLYEDYLLIKNKFKNFKPKYIDWNYGSLDDILIKEDLEISGKNILLGNSASFENNHIEAIELIEKMDLKDKKIICPLSYGDKDYANKIILYGNTKLMDKFEPLIDFMSIEKYNQTLSSCSIVIMNHLRQQALGNIILMIYFGAKVFLNKENPVYEFFKNNGAIVFSIEELTSENINNELTKKEKNINKEVLIKHWSKGVILQKTKKLIETMRNI
ncbi:MAG: TDP-N-acetylfucosamine:lipid II N-acetylfucosaminyltransferase [Aliarcobacter sp.]|nr:TDP-N-acetylfucosamine:lipid II N-acetylfucosaminyltransferase [Aliarcobacter sp.]